ncbi:MAG: hypothetical protein ABSA63_08485, partial [Thermoplasmata archaeon]
PQTSLALFLVGWGVAAALFSLYWWSGTSVGANHPAPLPGPAPPPVLRMPRPAEVSRTSFGDHLAPSFTKRGSEWRVLSLPANLGDETWLSWLPRETRRLGSEVVGASRRAVYSVSRPGSLVAVPNRLQGPTVRSRTMAGDLAVSSLTTRSLPKEGERKEPARSPTTLENLFHTPPTPATRPSSYTEDELDRLFPPAPGGHTTFLTGVPDQVGVREPIARDGRSGATSPRVWGDSPSPNELDHSMFEEDLAGNAEVDPINPPGQETFPEAPSVTTFRPTPVAGGSVDFLGRRSNADDLFLEAANPIPPHLRGIDRVEVRRSGRRSPDPAGPKTVCASCSKVVVNLRMSGPCPKCLRPICSECLRESFLAHGQGCCVDCFTPSAISAAC